MFCGSVFLHVVSCETEKGLGGTPGTPACQKRQAFGNLSRERASKAFAFTPAKPNKNPTRAVLREASGRRADTLFPGVWDVFVLAWLLRAVSAGCRVAGGFWSEVLKLRSV